MKNKLYRIIKFVFANCALALGILVLTLFILDKFNPAVGFMTLDMAKIFILLLAAFTIVYTSATIVEMVISRNKKQ